jgi:AraC family transcriptional regulator of adaptative response/methylated-DNA-[protein]-cysteine methyltransferase
MRNTTAASTIRYACRPTTYGQVFAAATERGVCLLHLIDPQRRTAALAELRRQYPGATFVEDEAALANVFRQVDAFADGTGDSEIVLDLRGTPFQQKVWRVMQRIPAGKTATYSDLARRAGVPKAVRAVASACARNPVCLFVPCHRIVRLDGGLGGYGGAGGVALKRRLLEQEGALTRV